MKKTVFLVPVFLPLLSLLLGSQFAALASNQYSRLAPRESEIIARINGTSAYNYDLELENIALNHYAFRSTGSPGASEAAQWIERQFESFGLEANMKSFEFTNWNLLSQPRLVIDDDHNASTTDDQKAIRSFQSEHYSWPTSEGGIFEDLVILPLPAAANREGIGKTLFGAGWGSINIIGKILLIGREVRWSALWHKAYVDKLKLQPPAAVIYTWWYDWMSFTPPMFSSMGGVPGSSRGSYYWDLGIPVGWVNYEDGLWIREREKSMNVFAMVSIPSVIGVGPHCNVVGKLKGSVNPEKTIIISGHYDTVMSSGFCDNGAGTAGVMELARVFTETAREGLYNPEYTLLFIAFTGEELGFVGSINYIKQHEAEMKNIAAVINLDCIGSDTLEVSETFTNSGELKLDDIILRAAEDLGIKAKLTDPGGSDQEAFRDPLTSNKLYNVYWGLDAGISNVTRVKPSTMIASYPLFYSDKWDEKGLGYPGWIHTEYDNSTSTNILNWVEVDHLEKHIQVAALSVMRILSYIYSPYLSQILAVTVVAGIVMVAAVYFERSRVSMALKKAYDNILYYIEMRELVLIIILTALFLFISFTMNTSIRKIEVIIRNFPTIVSVTYYGYPFEMLGIEYLTTGVQEPSEETLPLEWIGSNQVSTLILWNGLFLNLVLYFLLAFGLTYTATRLKHTYGVRKSK